MLSRYLQDYTRETISLSKSIIVNHALDHVLQHEDRRNKELINFIKDFIRSPEYVNYVIYKQNLVYRTTATQCDLDQELADPKYQIHLKHLQYPLTYETKKIHRFAEEMERYLRNQENLEALQKQLKGIEVIRAKIKEAKELAQVHQQQNQIKELKNYQVLQEFCEKHRISLSNIKLDTKAKLAQKVVCYQKIQRSRAVRISRNAVGILNKLIYEYKRVRRSKKPNEDTDEETELEEVIEMDSFEMYEDFKNENEEGNKDIDKPKEKKLIVKKHFTIVDERKPKELKEKSSLEDASTKANKSSKKSKPSKKGRRSKKDKVPKTPKNFTKSKEDSIHLQLPPIPIVNLRHKVKPNSYEAMVSLIKEFNKLEDYMENESIKDLCPDNIYPENKSVFLCKPEEILFKNCCKKRIFERRILIQNRSLTRKKCRVLKLCFTDPYDALLFDVEKIGVQDLRPGKKFGLTLKFFPKSSNSLVQGKLIMLFYDPSKGDYFQFSIGIKCLPKAAELVINPTNVTFGRIPFWKMKNVSKSIQFRNIGHNSCILVIKKVNLLEDDEDKENQDQTSIKSSSFDLVGNIKEILSNCVNKIFDSFIFDESFVQLSKLEEKRVRIHLNESNHVGNYLEIFHVDIYESKSDQDQLSLIGFQELTISLEVTGPFVELHPNYLDFEVCFYDLTYQLPVTITNTTSSVQTIIPKFPSNLLDYVSCNITNIFLQPFEKRSVFIRLYPQSVMFQSNISYFDKETSILEFPVYFSVIRNNYCDIPPIKLTVYAILCCANSLELHLKSGPSDILDFGKCTVFEEMVADVELFNRSMNEQIYFFKDLPRTMSVLPNDSGRIGANERKTVSLHFRPEFEGLVKFPIVVDSLANVAKCKQVVNMKRCKKKLENIMKEMQNPNNDILEDFLAASVTQLRKSFEIEQNVMGFDTLKDYLDSFENNYEEDGNGNKMSKTGSEEMAFINTKNQLWITANISRPLCELSAQLVEFFEVPCGSFSCTNIYLKCSPRNFQNVHGRFRIYGGNRDIAIEPTCGLIRSEETIKLTVIAKPEVPEDLVALSAKSLKRIKLYQEKLEETRLKSLKQIDVEVRKKKKKIATRKSKRPKSKRKKLKGKSEKKKKEVSSIPADVEASPPIEELKISDEELVIDPADLFPAEMHCWQLMEPYIIQKKFQIVIEYSNAINGDQEPDILYIDVLCRVVKPDFVSNLKLQRIDFGPAMIHSENVQNILIQNIKYETINPKIDLLNPQGPFSIPPILMDSPVLEPENVLKIPIKFCPIKCEKVEEFMAIHSNRTILPVILTGEGVWENVSLKPDFLVFRNRCKGDLVKYLFNMENGTSVDVDVKIVKVCELQGYLKMPNLKPKEEELEVPVTKKPKRKSSPKKVKSAKAAKQKTKKIKEVKETEQTNERKGKFFKRQAKNTPDLTAYEEASIKSFTKTKEDFFRVLEEDSFCLPGNSKKSLEIYFGEAEALESKCAALQSQREKRLLKEKKKKERKSAGKERKEKRSTKSNSSRTKVEFINIPAEDTEIYVAKFNILLNRMRFFKDLILIAFFDKFDSTLE